MAKSSPWFQSDIHYEEIFSLLDCDCFNSELYCQFKAQKKNILNTVQGHIWTKPDDHRKPQALQSKPDSDNILPPPWQVSTPH